MLLANDHHDRLVASLYASALGEANWGDTLAQIAQAFGASTSVLQAFDADATVIHSENYGFCPETSISYYASEAYANDPRLPHITSVPNGAIYCDHMLYDVEALSRDRWCRESIDILKVKYQLGGMAGLPDGGRVGFAVMSTEAEGQATEAAIVSFARLAAQFGQACALGQLVEKRALTQSALLEALSLQLEGVFLLDSCGAPTFVNDAAARVLAASDGLACAGGVLLTRRAAETRKLHAMIGAAIAGSSGERESAGRRMLVTRPSAKRPYVIRTMPVPRTDRFLTRTSIACVVHVQDLAAHQAPPAGALRMVFGLTEREAELAVQLTRCAGLEAAASSAGMAVNTARNHLHKIFQKTETSTQAQAVQLLSRIL